MADGIQEARLWCDDTPSGAGRNALDTLYLLSSDRPQLLGVRQTWTSQHRRDEAGLSYALQLDDALAVMRPTDDLSVPTLRRLGNHVMAWHAALPYTDGERAELLAIHRDIEAEHGMFSSVEKLPYTLRRTQALEILNAGIRNRTDARSIMPRWHDWRRQTGEFEGQGSLDRARLALAGMAELLVEPDLLSRVLSHRGISLPEQATEE